MIREKFVLLIHLSDEDVRKCRHKKTPLENPREFTFSDDSIKLQQEQLLQQEQQPQLQLLPLQPLQQPSSQLP